MRIKTIYIKSFGKLKDFRLSLKPGLNVIYGVNESGKTTVLNFIKMMFYGNASKSADIKKNPRRKYTPWDGSQMAGFIEFEHSGTSYRLEREFGSSNISDNISLWNLNTGQCEPLSCKYDAGERFMGVGVSAFEKSVFIGDVSSIINGSDKDDEISRKLMNYSSSGDETVSYELVRKRLQKAHEELRSRNGKNGEIDKLLQMLSDKTELLSKAEEEENLKHSDEELHTSFCDHLQKKKEYYDRISDSLKEQRIIRELHSLEVQNRKNIVKDELKQKLSKLNSDISNGSFTVTDAFLDQCSGMLSELSHLKESYAEKKTSFNSLSNEITDLRLSEIIQDNYADLDSLSDKISSLCSDVSKNENELNNIIGLIDDLNTRLKETQLKEELYKEHIADMESNYITLIPVTAIIIAAIALLFKNPWILVSILPSCATLFFMGKLLDRISKKRNLKSGLANNAPDYEKAYKEFEEYREQYENQKAELYDNISALKSEISDTETKRKELETENNKLIIQNEQKTSELNRINASLSQTSSSITNLESDILFTFSKFRSVSNIIEIEHYIEEIQNTLSEIEKTKAVLESKLEEDIITDSPEEIKTKMENLKIKLSALTQVSGPKLISDEQVEQLENELEETKQEISSLKDEISNMRSRILSRYHSQETPSVLRNDIDRIKSNIAKMAVYDKSLLIAADVIEEAAGEIRQTFTPELNSKTERIFSHLTDGKYNETIVSKNLEITSAVNENASLREWQYLSTGTAEQAYFALRLALSDMLTKNQVPLFLDDVFAHYDDERTRRGFMFLNEYSRLNQILFFTCHKYKAVSDRYIMFPEK